MYGDGYHETSLLLCIKRILLHIYSGATMYFHAMSIARFGCMTVQYPVPYHSMGGHQSLTMLLSCRTYDFPPSTNLRQVFQRSIQSIRIRRLTLVRLNMLRANKVLSGGFAKWFDLWESTPVQGGAYDGRVWDGAGEKDENDDRKAYVASFQGQFWR
jgi:hypothetical protein